ncbi:MAG: ATP-dependent DNA ligase [Salinisphaeraceae bacterium]|nr:ATP-dependent DNA ligase [Salinisphaeraceae bacterium]
MQRFAELYTRLDSTTATNDKVAALKDYFQSAPAEDAAWAVHFLVGRRLKRLVPNARLREWAGEVTGYAPWMIEECYSSVGDLAETVTLLLDAVATGQPGHDRPLHEWVETRIEPLRKMDEADQRDAVTGWWRDVPTDQRFVLNKLLTGAFRVGVAKRLVTRALAEHGGLDTSKVAHRLMGRWIPSGPFFERLLDPEDHGEDAAQPYPFFLASPIEQMAGDAGPVSDWLVEWKWDGIRAQLIRRQGQCHIWSRGEEPMPGRFPEIEQAAAQLPDGCVLDGEILAWKDDAPMPFAQLQRRIGRLKPSEKLQAQAPVIFQAYDLLEGDGRDLRDDPIEARRSRLTALLDAANAGPALRISGRVEADSWDRLEALRAESRERGTEGFILKRAGSPYRVGRKRGDWWKWKVEPYTVDAVLLYAQPGHGRRSNLLTDYTFGVWDGDEIVPFAKAYSGLTDKEISELDRWIRRHTKERFGPVRSVELAQVFELAFEGIRSSNRHKSGIAVRFPRIARWRRDLAIADAEQLQQIRDMLPAGG